MPVFRKDPCGIICITLTYLAVIYADYVVIRWIIMQTMHDSLWGAFNAILFNTTVFLLVMSHTRAVFSDPGIVPLPRTKTSFSDFRSGISKKPEYEDGPEWNVCPRCDSFRPPRAHHCRVCRRCIRRMDHHCPWINNCVGEWNQKFFIQFLLYVAVLSGYAIVLIIISWVKECKDCPTDIQTKQTRLLHSVLLLLESILFGLFVTAVLTDQIQAVLTDETAVEQIKGDRPSTINSKPSLVLMAEVCGRGHPLKWLLPCVGAPYHPASYNNYDV